MDQVLRDFLLVLRGSGVKVSIPESIDAANTVDLVGYGDRELLKDSLAAVLAKSAEEDVTFGECFDSFFTTDAFSKRIEEGFVPQVEGVTSPLSLMFLSGNTGGLAASMRNAAQGSGITQIQFQSQKGWYLREILSRMGLEELRRDISRLHQENTSGSRQVAERLEQAEEYLLGNVKDFVEQQFDLFSRSAKERVLERYLKSVRLSTLEQRDLHRMQEIIQKMVKRLNDVHSRRRKTFRRGQLDFRKTLRSNVTYQGLLFDLKWKRKKIDRPDVVALCDVSSSVAAVARFLLLFLYSLNKRLARIRTFTFCSNLVEVSHVFDEDPVEEALVKLQRGLGLGILMGPTDYGQSLGDFERGWSDTITRKTTVLILGDARNNYGDPGTEILRSLHQRCKRLIWLNPEPPSVWGSGDSEMKKYLPFCHLARECSTITHLERVVDSLLHVQ